MSDTLKHVDAVRCYAMSQKIETEGTPLDSYARRGVVLSRDAASTVLGALHREAATLTERGGLPNIKEAQTLRLLALNIHTAMSN